MTETIQLGVTAAETNGKFTLTVDPQTLEGSTGWTRAQREAFYNFAYAESTGEGLRAGLRCSECAAARLHLHDNKVETAVHMAGDEQTLMLTANCEVGSDAAAENLALRPQTLHFLPCLAHSAILEFALPEVTE